EPLRNRAVHREVKAASRAGRRASREAGSGVYVAVQRRSPRLLRSIPNMGRGPREGTADQGGFSGQEERACQSGESDLARPVRPVVGIRRPWWSEAPSRSAECHALLHEEVAAPWLSPMARNRTSRSFGSLDARLGLAG